MSHTGISCFNRGSKNGDSLKTQITNCYDIYKLRTVCLIIILVTMHCIYILCQGILQAFPPYISAPGLSSFYSQRRGWCLRSPVRKGRQGVPILGRGPTVPGAVRWDAVCRHLTLSSSGFSRVRPGSQVTDGATKRYGCSNSHGNCCSIQGLNFTLECLRAHPFLCSILPA